MPRRVVGGVPGKGAGNSPDPLTYYYDDPQPICISYRIIDDKYKNVSVPLAECTLNNSPVTTVKPVGAGRGGGLSGSSRVGHFRHLPRFYTSQRKPQADNKRRLHINGK